MTLVMTESASKTESKSLHGSHEERPVLNELRDQLLSRLPGRVRRIVLFGSRARGDFDDASDFDVLILLEDCAPSVVERARSVRYEVMERRGFQPLISLLVLSEQEWQQFSKHSAGLKHNIETEGLTIWPTT
jgi:predicted nucleotidyltransferase